MSRDDRDLLDDMLERIRLTAEFVWQIVEEDLPPLKTEIEIVLHELAADD